MAEPNPLWEVIQTYMDDPKHRYSPKPADLARETGVSEQVLSKWKRKSTLPSPGQLAKVSIGTGIPFEDLLYAALAGKHYLPAYQDMTLQLFESRRGRMRLPGVWTETLARFGVGDPLTPARAVALWQISKGGGGDGAGNSAPIGAQDEVSEDTPSLRSVANKGNVEPEEGALTDP